MYVCDDDNLADYTWDGEISRVNMVDENIPNYLIAVDDDNEVVYIFLLEKIFQLQMNDFIEINSLELTSFV